MKTLLKVLFVLLTVMHFYENQSTTPPESPSSWLSGETVESPGEAVVAIPEASGEGMSSAPPVIYLNAPDPRAIRFIFTPRFSTRPREVEVYRDGDEVRLFVDGEARKDAYLVGDEIRIYYDAGATTGIQIDDATGDLGS